MSEAGLLERIERKAATAVAAFESLPVEADTAKLTAFCKLGVEMTRWAKQIADARASTLRADKTGDRVQAQLRRYLLEQAVPANDAAPTVMTDGADTDADGDPTTPEELEQFGRELDEKLAGLGAFGWAPEQKSAGNRAQRRRLEKLARAVVRPGA